MARAAADLEAVFTDAVTARHVAERLACCGSSDPVQDIIPSMAARGFDVLGVEDERGVVGYIERNGHTDGAVGDHLRVFHPRELISDSTPLIDLLRRLSDAPRVFVLSRSGVRGIATRGDLQKAPMRAYLFGLITAFEMTLTRRLRAHHSEETWTQWLSSGRLEKAEQLLAQRRARNEDIDLLECLQLADKRTLVLRSPSLSALLPFADRKEALAALDGIEKLRDRLAHGQDLIAGTTWEGVSATVGHLTRLVDFLDQPAIDTHPAGDDGVHPS